MAKPFMALDGEDSNGVRAEVWVQTGTGVVAELKEKGKNINVQMRVEGLEHAVQGWTSKEENIYPILVDALASGREVSYRIEAQRKEGIDRALPLSPLRANMELGKKNTNVLFVGIDGTLSSEAVTNPAEDPHSGGRVPATDPRYMPQNRQSQQSTSGAAGGSGGGLSVEQALKGLANARQGGLSESIIDASTALALAAGASVEQVLAAGFEGQQTPRPSNPRRSVAAEAAPFKMRNTDDRINVGSYAVQAAVGAESFAAEMIAANNAAVVEAHNAAVAAGDVAGEPMDPTPLDFRQAAVLGATVLGLADQVQAAVTGGRPDRMASSHTRSRSMVYDAIKNRHPIPFGQSEDAHVKWKGAVVEEATTRLQYAVRIAVPEETPAQQSHHGQGEARRQPAQQGSAPVHQINPQAAPKVPVEGSPEFEAPSEEARQRFGSLATAAGFDASPESPIGKYLELTFGVTAVRQVHGPVLGQMLDWYASKGEEGPGLFRNKVMSTVSQSATA